MKNIDLFEEIMYALLANKARSGLTILGIVIGIASVIGMIAIGEGSKSNIESSIQSLGSNLIMVTPGTQRGPGMQVSQGRGSAQTLKLSDAEAIKEEVALVSGVAPEVSSRYQVLAKGTNTNTSVIGTVAEYLEMKNLAIQSGSFINDQHLKGLSRVAVIGPTVRDDLFGEEVDPVGQKIRINKMEFQIIGMTEEKGGTGFNNPDNVIYIPISVSQQYLTGGDYVSTINVQAANQASMTAVQEQVTSLLMQRHNITDATQADFSTMNQADIVATASSVTNTFTMLLGSVASISLIVGGIGIMNMMLTTVTERTKEIGLRKAIGARRRDINQQFLGEAIVLTVLGGLVGIALGWAVSFLAFQFGGIATKVSSESIILAFGVSGAIGIIFGYYPASRASKMNPIECLRYE
ncbi:MAG: ABC transporter permease [Minisyncoccus archaeiphilus]|uniref:ABC transporter permease n=1 Tax=Minisyncoccus archaeiphilus TaxID=3238481 RepID=UPI002B063BA3|nr:MAG: ABC transporter permease [Candidatus Parcubacteria bacterium]